MTRTRALPALLLIAATGALAHGAGAPRPTTAVTLERLPYRLASRTGRDTAAPDAETRRVLGADAYLTRSYVTGSGAPVDLYVAYYAQQRPSVSMHSPLHCLPGTGWEPLDVATIDVAEPDGRGGQVRRLIVRKNMQRAVVIYWYAIHGRTIAGELTSKAWLFHDSLLHHRSDAALVRIVVPVRGTSIDDAQREALAFADALRPSLPRLWS